MLMCEGDNTWRLKPDNGFCWTQNVRKGQGVQPKPQASEVATCNMLQHHPSELYKGDSLFPEDSTMGSITGQ